MQSVFETMEKTLHAGSRQSSTPSETKEYKPTPKQIREMRRFMQFHGMDGCGNTPRTDQSGTVCIFDLNTSFFR